VAVAPEVTLLAAHELAAAYDGRVVFSASI
jgi:hypothetical protein